MVSFSTKTRTIDIDLDGKTISIRPFGLQQIFNIQELTAKLKDDKAADIEKMMNLYAGYTVDNIDDEEQKATWSAFIKTAVKSGDGDFLAAFMDLVSQLGGSFNQLRSRVNGKVSADTEKAE